MIYLQKSELQKLPILSTAVNEMREAYIAVVDGRANLPPVGYLRIQDHNADCHVKFGHISGDSLFVVKVATGFYDNPKYGLSVSNGTMLAISAETGAVVAILCDEGWLTDLRTGIGGALATLSLCRPDSSFFGIVGTGTQARYQIRCLRRMCERPISFAIWGRDPAKAAELRTELRSEDIEVKVETEIEQLCRGSDVIVTTTPSRHPIVQSDWIRPGTHITALGADAPGKQELDIEILQRANLIVVDSREQCADHGEIAAAVSEGKLDPNDCVEFGNVLAGKALGRGSPADITVADLTGVATQDIAIVRATLAAVNDSGTYTPRSIRAGSQGYKQIHPT